jgi:superfamily II DNA or RNA helicase
VSKEHLPDMTRARIMRNDYDPRALAKATIRKHLIGNIFEDWKQRAQGRATALFAASIKHSARIVETFRKGGVRAAHLDSHTSIPERKEMLHDLTSGKLHVVSNVNVLSEGWDCPPCKCIVLARPTLSFNLHMQQTTRCIRPFQGVRPLVLDHAGNTLMHGPPQLERPWQLEAPSTTLAAPAAAKVCRECYAVMPLNNAECTECGHPFPTRDRLLEEEPGALHEYQISEAEKKADLAHIQSFAKEKGLSADWAARVFEAKYASKTVR